MLYNKIKTMHLYKKQKMLNLPKGDKTGFGNLLIMLTPNTESSISNLQSDYIKYGNAFYKYYTTDFIYNEKIGKKNIRINRTTEGKKEFYDLKFPKPLTLVLPTTRGSFCKKKVNMILDIGYWFDLYNQYSYKNSIKLICNQYINFLSAKINNPEFIDYNKIIYVPVDDWIISRGRKFGFTKELMDNPINIILFSMYKYPELLTVLGDVDFIFTNKSTNEFMRINSKEMIKENYHMIKSKIMKFDDITTIKEIDEMIDSDDDKIDDAALAQDIISKAENKQEKINRVKIYIANQMKKRLLGDLNVEDITDETEDPDKKEIDIADLTDEEPSPESEERIEVNEFDEEIDKVVNDLVENDPTVLEKMEDEKFLKEVEKVLKKKIFRPKYMPKNTEETMKKIQYLSGVQDQVIGEPSYADIKTKIIDESDYSSILNTKNANITYSKFANFEKSYNKKKLNKDIDDAIGILSDAEIKVFVTGKEEKDTSDQLNFKKTVTYYLEDQNGMKHTIKLDIPKIIDDKYVYLNGNKKIIQHQLILKPIVKVAPDTVQIVTFYNKMFIYRKGDTDVKTSSLKKYITSNASKFKMKPGNVFVKNKAHITPIEFDMLAKNITEFSIGDYKFVMYIDKLLDILKNNGIDYNSKPTRIPIAYNLKNRSVIDMDINKDNFSDIVTSYMTEKDKAAVNKTKIPSKLMYSEVVMMQKHIPLVLFMLYCEGFTNLMKRAGIKYKVYDLEEVPDYDKTVTGDLWLTDKCILWDREPTQNSLLLNGLQQLAIEMYSYDELDSKDTYIDLLCNYYEYSNMSYNLDQYKDFMIDKVSKEILMDYNLPTDLTGVLLYANKLLTETTYKPENNLLNLRVRSNEIISQYVYTEITKAYGKYRKTQYKNKPMQITIPQNAIMKAMKTSQLVEDSSSLNPILELEKNRSVTYKGDRGINMEKAFSIDKRAYDDTMIGVIGISTSPDAGVGILRQLTLEPNITSTRGYIDVTPMEKVDDLNSANLLTPAEMLTPGGVLHDDGQRTSIDPLVLVVEVKLL